MGPTGDSSSGEDATGEAVERPSPEGGGPSPAQGTPPGADRSARLRRILYKSGRVLAYALTGFVGLSLVAVLFYAQRPVPATLLMAQRALEGEEVRYAWRPIEAISPDLVRAVIAAEDARFCSHSGFDFDAIQEAVREAERRGRLRGASTISQQTAKNTFLWPQRSWVRKGAETWFTMLVEALWPKRRIMEVYLNVAEWGDGVFGAEAAAQVRFGKSAAELTAREAALLAAVLPNPHQWRVDPPGAYVSGRAASLQRRMGDVRAGDLDSCVL